MPHSSDTAQQRGQRAEARALHHLAAHGLRLIESNYRCRGGEIDLIMRDGEYLVFVEVRYRSHAGFGGAAASIDGRKQRRLIHAARHYLQRHRMTERPCRFDVVAIGPQGPNDLEWLQNAILATE